jgi:hypothetical protein
MGMLLTLVQSPSPESVGVWSRFRGRRPWRAVGRRDLTGRVRILGRPALRASVGATSFGQRAGVLQAAERPEMQKGYSAPPK